MKIENAHKRRGGLVMVSALDFELGFDFKFVDDFAFFPLSDLDKRRRGPSIACLLYQGSHRLY